MRRILISTAALLLPSALLASQAQKQEVEGIRNFTRVDATVACAGSTAPESIAWLASQGFKSIINLRLATEDGAAIEESKAAAEAAHIKYIRSNMSAQSCDSVPPAPGRP